MSITRVSYGDGRTGVIDDASENAAVVRLVALCFGGRLSPCTDAEAKDIKGRPRHPGHGLGFPASVTQREGGQ